MNPSVRIRLPDDSTRTYPSGVTVAEIAASIGKRLARDAIGGLLDVEATVQASGRAPKVIDVHTPLHQDASLRIITVGSPEGLEVLRHSTAHLMASAVQALFPGTQVTIGPATADGFYYDFDRPAGFSPEDLRQIEAKMHALAAADLPLIRQEVDRQQARTLFAGLGERYKCELIDAIPADDPITLYRHGDWQDLCRGPHVPRTGLLKAFRLTHVAGAYWRGDERNPMLARIYGTAFWSQKELDAHFARLEEIKRRDHRRLGKDLDLFSFHALAPAMPFFHPAGTVVYNALTDMVRAYYRLLGFAEVITPQIFDMQLFEQSGHAAHYEDNMFICPIDERRFGVKPMNCPGHTLMYAAQRRSYRELPLRLADFGRLHRHERSGVTAGLTRVRSFAQDDAHIFCREAQIGEEIHRQLLMLTDLYGHFGFVSHLRLATRPQSSLGREPGLEAEQVREWDNLWERAEGLLLDALRKSGAPFTTSPGDGAFYGPKIDCQVEDALGRAHQLGTIQLDFGLPRRFNLTYMDEHSQPQRPVMVHRAVLGSLERFMGILLEHTGGCLPLFLAPEQVRVLVLGTDVLDYGRAIAQRLLAAGLRVRLDGRQEKLGYKIRDAEVHKIPRMWVIGAKEAAAGTVSVRQRGTAGQADVPLDQAVRDVVEAAAVPAPGAALQALAVPCLDLV